jgi:thiol-disulfide isomerase/thioredoxin
MRKYKIILLALLFVGSLLNAQNIKPVKITDLEKIITESKKPLVINFWATWCLPCIEELPYFIEEVKQYNDMVGIDDTITLLLVSLDFKEAYPTAITAFATKRKIASQILWLNETNADFFCPKISPQWSGAIPATLFVNNANHYRNFIESQLSRLELKAAISAMVAK